MVSDIPGNLESAVPPRAASLLMEAGHLYMAAGESALAAGSTGPAIAMLTRARDILTCVDDPAVSAAALELLLTALVEAGQAASANLLTAWVDELECAGLELGRLALLRLQLARADAVAEEPTRGIARVHDARALLSKPTSPVTGAALDAVEAWLMTQVAEDGGDQAAEALARRALAATGSGDQPQVACQAWEVMGILARRHDLAGSTTCFRHVRALAHQRRLPFWRLRAQLELGLDDWLRTGETHRLALVRRAATASGALAVACSADTAISLQLIFHGRYDEAARMIGQRQAQASAAGLAGEVRWLTLARSVLAAHQCRRRDMEMALREFGLCGGDASRLMPMAQSLSRAVCSLLEENWEQAGGYLDRGVSHSSARPGPYPLAGWNSLHQLLAQISGAAQREDTPEPAVTAEEVPFWNLPFALFGQAVFLGRHGREPEALAALAQAEQAAAPYALLRHLGLRLVAEAARRDDWGTPSAWLRRANQYFRDHPGSAVANACGSLLRQIGTPVASRRQDLGRIPDALRMLGVTVREYEVLSALMARAANKDIAAQLYISPRTVEKHVANLLAKTGQPNRTALTEFARDIFRANIRCGGG
jgi:DNA-binding CsgD family transcriptional regulator